MPSICQELQPLQGPADKTSSSAYSGQQHLSSFNCNTWSLQLSSCKMFNLSYSRHNLAIANDRSPQLPISLTRFKACQDLDLNTEIVPLRALNSQKKTGRGQKSEKTMVSLLAILDFREHHWRSLGELLLNILRRNYILHDHQFIPHTYSPLQ